MLFSDQVFNNKNKAAYNLLYRYDDKISTLDVSKQSSIVKSSKIGDKSKTRFSKSRNCNI